MSLMIRITEGVIVVCEPHFWSTITVLNHQPQIYCYSPLSPILDGAQWVEGVQYPTATPLDPDNY